MLNTSGNICMERSYIWHIMISGLSNSNPLNNHIVSKRTKLHCCYMWQQWSISAKSTKIIVSEEHLYINQVKDDTSFLN